MLNKQMEIAKIAYNNIKDNIKNIQQEEEKKEYKSHIKHILSLLQISGITQAFSFALTKKKNTYNMIISDTKEYLSTLSVIKEKFKNKELIDSLLTLTSEEYMIVTSEVRDFFIWLKRFADGLIKD